jgi:hypothetical protein
MESTKEAVSIVAAPSNLPENKRTLVTRQTVRTLMKQIMYLK